MLEIIVTITIVYKYHKAVVAWIWQNTSDLGLIFRPREHTEFDFIHSPRVETTLSHHVGCTKTNCVNVTQLSHVELMSAFEIIQLSASFYSVGTTSYD